MHLMLSRKDDKLRPATCSVYHKQHCLSLIALLRTAQFSLPNNLQCVSGNGAMAEYVVRTFLEADEAVAVVVVDEDLTLGLDRSASMSLLPGFCEPPGLFKSLLCMQLTALHGQPGGTAHLSGLAAETIVEFTHHSFWVLGLLQGIQVTGRAVSGVQLLARFLKSGVVLDSRVSIVIVCLSWTSLQ